jgi:hypothetical protein
VKIVTKIVLLAVAALGSLFFTGGSLGQAGDSANGIEGVWAGVLGGQLHLVVTITRSSSGELGGTMNSLDQHAVLALSNVTLEGSAVRFEVQRVGGVYEGQLKKNGRDISGSWTQTACRRRRSISRAARTPAGLRMVPRREVRRRPRSPKPSTRRNLWCQDSTA